eukprot:m51a1_g13925 hypothetical protein (479) ;mRNA; f:823118-824937
MSHRPLVANPTDSCLLIAHGTVCTLGSEVLRVVPDGAVLAVNDEIALVGPTADVIARAPTCARVVDASGALVLPGFVCAHSHFYGLFSRGMSLHDDPPADFLQVLERLWWRLDRALDLEAVGLCAEVNVARGLRNGTTCYVDHHASPLAIAGSLDALASASTRLGARAAYCYEVTDRNGRDGARAGIAENVRFMRRCMDGHEPLLGATFGLHAQFTLSDETLAECTGEMAKLRAQYGSALRGGGFHVHAAEGLQDEDDSVSKHGVRAVLRLERAGVLGPDSIVGHGVHADAAEVEALVRTATPLVINPQSNMNNAVGLPDPAHLKRLPLVGLGTDGMTYDMLEEFRAAALAFRHRQGDPRVFGAGEAINLLCRGNSLIASRLFAKPVGRLEPGCYADVLVVDYRPPTQVTEGNLPWHIQFGMSAGDVRDVFVGGRQVVGDGKLLTADECEIAERARKAAPRVWEAFGKIADRERAAHR